LETNLRALRVTTAVCLIRLIEGDIPTDDDLREIKTYAGGIGPNTRLVIPANDDRTLRDPTDLVQRAHAIGLIVHV